MSTENQFEKHDDETIIMACKAVEAVGLAYPSLPKVRNDFLQMMAHLRDDFRRGSVRSAAHARSLAHHWIDTRPYYLDSLRWADFTMWRYTSDGSPPKTRNGYAEGDEVMRMMQSLLGCAFQRMAIAALDFLTEQEASQ
jgi:hypothetical protein